MRQESFGQGARGPTVEVRHGTVLWQLIGVAGDLTRRRDVELPFLFLLRLEPAVVPGPEVDATPDLGVLPIETDGALEEDARVVVGLEGRGVLQPDRGDVLGV